MPTYIAPWKCKQIPNANIATELQPNEVANYLAMKYSKNTNVVRNTLSETWTPTLLKRGQILPPEDQTLPILGPNSQDLEEQRQVIHQPASIPAQTSSNKKNQRSSKHARRNKSRIISTPKDSKNQPQNPSTTPCRNSSQELTSDPHSQWCKQEGARLEADFCTDIKARIISQREVDLQDHGSWRQPQIPGHWKRWNEVHMALAGVPKHLTHFVLKVLKRWEADDEPNRRAAYMNLGPDALEIAREEISGYITDVLSKSKELVAFSELFEWLYGVRILDAFVCHSKRFNKSAREGLGIKQEEKTEVEWDERPMHYKTNEQFIEGILNWLDEVEISDAVNTAVGCLESTISQLKDLEIGDEVGSERLKAGRLKRPDHYRQKDEDDWFGYKGDTKARESELLRLALWKFEEEEKAEKAIIEKKKQQGFEESNLEKRCEKCGQLEEVDHMDGFCDRVFFHEGKMYSVRW